MRVYSNRLLKRAKLDGLDERGQKLRVHSLRRHFATRLVSSGTHRFPAENGQ